MAMFITLNGGMTNKSSFFALKFKKNTRVVCRFGLNLFSQRTERSFLSGRHKINGHINILFANKNLFMIDEKFK